MKNNVILVKMRSIFNKEKIANIKASLTKPRTKRQWAKILARLLLVVGLITLVVLTSSQLLKRAPYEFGNDKLNVAYLQNKNELGELKKVPQLSSFIEPNTTYIAYYTENGEYTETDLASGVLVSQSAASYEQILTQFTQSTQGCEIKSETVRGTTEYLRATCQEALLDLYAFKNADAGIIFFSSDLENNGLEKLLQNY